MTHAAIVTVMASSSYRTCSLRFWIQVIRPTDFKREMWVPCVFFFFCLLAENMVKREFATIPRLGWCDQPDACSMAWLACLEFCFFFFAFISLPVSLMHFNFYLIYFDHEPLEITFDTLWHGRKKNYRIK